MEQPCVPVHVALSGLNGDTLDLTTYLHFDISSLKRQVKDQWGIPPIFQKLVFDLGPQRSTSTITACLTLGMDEFREQITSQPVLAVQNLVQLPSSYRVADDVFHLIGATFNNRGQSLEYALTGVDAPLDRVVESALRLCGHAQASIKYAAMRSLRWKLNAGTWSDVHLDRAVAAAIGSCHDADAWVRWESLCFLNSIASPRREHSNTMIAVALELCRDDDVHVRRAAARILSKRDFEQTEAIIHALCTYAVDVDAEVRVTAWEVLRRIGGKSDVRVLDAAVACLNDLDPGIQLPALAFLNERSRAEAANAILSHSDGTIRLTAMSVLEKIVQVGEVNENAEKRARPHPRHPAVACALEAACSDHAAVTLLTCKFLQDPLLEVRNRALALLSQIVSPNDEAVVRAVCSGLDHASGGVQESSLRAMAIVASKGNETVICALCAWLLPGRPSAVRALKLLSAFAEPGDPNAVRVVHKCLEDDRYAVQDLARKILLEWSVPCGVTSSEASECEL